EYDSLRIGWDLVLDIDCPVWEFAKLVSALFVKALQDHGIKAVTAKFSGNKGFHMAVPFEAFPEKVVVKGQEMMTKDMFPEGPRRIAAYLLDFIGKKYVSVSVDKITFGGTHSYTFAELEHKTGKDPAELLQTYCTTCSKKSTKQSEKKISFTCPKCGSSLQGDVMDEYKSCTKCGVIMERSVHDTTRKCCAKPNIVTVFNPLSIVEVDTVLIAPRHLYRAPYSYHEKSGLVSVPIHPDSIIDFEKNEAEPSKIKIGKYGFLDREGVSPGQAAKLLVEAMDFTARKEIKARNLEDLERAEKQTMREFEEVQSAIPEQFFPPCVQLISKGLKDGKKRAVFVMTNFLASCGWDYDAIEEWLRKWNENNPEPLRDQGFLGQLRYAKQQNKKVLPPNCDNTAYYKSFGVCQPDGFCRYIKNPANYAIKRARYAQKDAGKGKKGVKKPSEAQEPSPGSESQTL
ncbi:hypothetical protein KY363_07705, partial [Candidatus Woesearchaeota archaeon]|nr:hypothetical protein [Candidatus Woesearchaeota archaeon]